MKLVIITQPQFFIEEDRIITALFDEGLDSLHLYKPGSSPLYFERLLTLIPEDYHSKIVIHEHFYMKQEFDLAGIHLDDPDADVPQGYRGKVTRSCTDLSKLKETKKKSQYVFLHDIFDRQQNNSSESSFSESTIYEASRQGLIDKHVYAFGGMNADNIRWAHDAGFGGVVLCSDIWNRFDIHSQVDYNDVIQHFQRLRKLAR